MDGDLNFCAVARKMFVDRIVEHFKNHVVQTALVRVADIHARAFSDSFEAFEFVDLRGVVFLASCDPGGCVSRGFSEGNFVLGLEHKCLSNDRVKR